VRGPCSIFWKSLGRPQAWSLTWPSAQLHRSDVLKLIWTKFYKASPDSGLTSPSPIWGCHSHFGDSKWCTSSAHWTRQGTDLQVGKESIWTQLGEGNCWDRCWVHSQSTFLHPSKPPNNSWRTWTKPDAVFSSVVTVKSQGRKARWDGHM
jgi:hypothetical protein